MWVLTRDAITRPRSLKIRAKSFTRLQKTRIAVSQLFSFSHSFLATFCIAFYRAEKIRDLPDNILSIMVNLNSLVHDHTRMLYPGARASSIVTILLTTCSWEKFYSGTFAFEPTCLYLKAYTREQLAQILIKAAPVDSPRYARFIDILLTVCLPVTRNTNELLFLAQVSGKGHLGGLSSHYLLPLA